MAEELRIIYMGTPEFAVVPLKAILDHGFKVEAVVTAPDKPAGRGLNIRQPAVKTFASEYSIPVIQPVNLKDPAFLQELKNYHANIQVVVAFRMLPESIWNMPEHGTFNLHASYLPQYRGAAPINWVLINGEDETGLTTFQLDHTIDTGKILFRERHPIYPDDDAQSLHDRLASSGGNLVVKTLQSIQNKSVIPQDQEGLIDVPGELKTAPKLHKEDCRIQWEMPAYRIYNLVRGLSPVPSAFTMLRSDEGALFSLKIYRSVTREISLPGSPGHIVTDGRSYLQVITGRGVLDILDLQLEGKKRMSVSEFLRGFRMNEGWKMV